MNSLVSFFLNIYQKCFFVEFLIFLVLSNYYNSGDVWLGGVNSYGGARAQRISKMRRGAPGGGHGARHVNDITLNFFQEYLYNTTYIAINPLMHISYRTQEL